MYATELLSGGVRSKIGCAGVVFIAGIVIGLFGWLFPVPQVTPTTGVIVESRRLVSSSPAREITYDYVAFGVHHREKVFVHSGPQSDSMYQVGESFPVFFVTAHPERSYAPGPPQTRSFTFVGLVLAVGSGVVILTWPRST